MLHKCGRDVRLKCIHVYITLESAGLRIRLLVSGEIAL